MKGSYITTPRYLMHSVKGQEWEGQTKIVTEWATEKTENFGKMPNWPIGWKN